jgi:hypothetical protein
MNFNDTGIPERGTVDEIVRRNFHGTVNNTCGSDHNVDLEEIRQFTFIMSPPDFRLGLLNIVEGPYTGSIPIVEHYNRSDGRHRALDGLPVLMGGHVP